MAKIFTVNTLIHSLIFCKQANTLSHSVLCLKHTNPNCSCISPSLSHLPLISSRWGNDRANNISLWAQRWQAKFGNSSPLLRWQSHSQRKLQDCVISVHHINATAGRLVGSHNVRWIPIKCEKLRQVNALMQPGHSYTLKGEESASKQRQNQSPYLLIQVSDPRSVFSIHWWLTVQLSQSEWDIFNFTHVPPIKNQYLIILFCCIPSRNADVTGLQSLLERCMWYSNI